MSPEKRRPNRFPYPHIEAMIDADHRRAAITSGERDELRAAIRVAQTTKEAGELYEAALQSRA